MPALSEVELPVPGCWTAFRAGRDLYVLRTDADGAWTLLDEGGRTRGTLRRTGTRYRGSTNGVLGPADVDWRAVVRELVRARASSPTA